VRNEKELMVVELYVIRILIEYFVVIDLGLFSWCEVFTGLMSLRGKSFSLATNIKMFFGNPF